jgi:RNA polymerase sigma-70 factor (ECF subfamily)
MDVIGQPTPDIDTLYRDYGGIILRRVRRFYNGDEAEDVFQEVFMRIIDKLDTFRGESSMVTWLYQITTRYCLNRLRNSQRRQALWEERSDAIYWSQPITPANQEKQALYNQIWRALDEDLLNIGVYYYLDGMTHAEIARILGVSRRTVGNRLIELQRRAKEVGGTH